MSVYHLRARLAALDTQILQQRRVLDELEQSRSDVERELFATATYDVLTLPVEITTEIFFVCHATGAALWIPCGKYPGTPAPLVLSAVCRGWRAIALATPTLWDSLGVDFEKVTSNTEAADILIDSWLVRAQPHPLSLEISSGAEVQGSVASLKALTHRWSQHIRSLTLIVWGDVHGLALHLAMFPILERAVLCGGTSNPLSPAVGIFQNAPLLHDIQLGWSLYPRQFQFDWEWNRLTKYYGRLDSMELFVLAPALIELTCSFIHALDASFAVTHHPTLESLTVEAHEYTESLDILQYLTLPCLRHLDIFDSKNNHDSLQLFLARSSPPLQSMIVEMNEACSDQWGECLLIVASTLERVELHGIRDADRSITHDFVKPLFSARLAIQSLTFKRAGECDARTLMRLLHVLSDRALKSFTFVWDLPPLLSMERSVYANQISDTFVGHLCRLSRAGMEIYLGTEYKNYITE